jgi:glycosyltransferase involved in cell wall biosynthesis
MKLVVDLRRAFDSGLGTYIRHVVPDSVARLSSVVVTGLIAAGDEDKHRAYWGHTKVAFQTVTAAPLSVAEQWELRSACPPGAVFWATTLSHALFTSQRLVATVHDVAQLALPASAGISPAVRWASRAFFSSLRRRAELLLFNSHTTATEFQRYVGSTPATGVVTPLGVVEDAWKCPQRKPHSTLLEAVASAPYFLWLGNLRPHKNLALLLAAFEEISAVLPHHLVVVGRAAAGTSTATWLRAMPVHLQGRIHLLGEVDAAQLPGLMHSATALVMPSLYEGFGLPMLEAFAASCLVLASDIAAHREVAGEVSGEVHGQTALFFDPLNSHELAQALLQVTHQPAESTARRLGAGLARAHTMSWQRTAALTAAALQTVLDGHRQNGPHATSHAP